MSDDVINQLRIKQSNFMKGMLKSFIKNNVKFKRVENVYQYIYETIEDYYKFEIKITDDLLILKIFDDVGLLFNKIALKNIHRETKEFVKYLRKQEERVGNV